MQTQIRDAASADVGTIHEIYNYYVENCTCTFQIEPETLAERQAWFDARRPEHPVTIAEVQGTAVGWAALSTWNSRKGYARTVEASIYIHHDWHRRGIGRKLLQDLINRARELGHHVIIGGACTEQTASIALQESLGFQTVGQFREVGFKFGRWLDVVYLQLSLEPDESS